MAGIRRTLLNQWHLRVLPKFQFSETRATLWRSTFEMIIDMRRLSPLRRERARTDPYGENDTEAVYIFDEFLTGSKRKGSKMSSRCEVCLHTKSPGLVPAVWSDKGFIENSELGSDFGPNC